MPVIPVNPEDYPTDYEPLDESITYKVTVRAFDFAPKLDKNGNEYLNATLEVLEPETFMGHRINEPYIGIPLPITADMNEGERYKARRSGIKFAQFSKCFGIKSGPDGIITEAALGAVGWVSIQNETYQGRKNSKIKDYLFPSE